MAQNMHFDEVVKQKNPSTVKVEGFSLIQAWLE